MPKIATKQPPVSKEKGQRSFIPENYLTRYVPYWLQPNWEEAKMWRRVVANQPIATICRETLLSYINSLDWKIEPRDSTQRDELKDEIDYYTKLFDSGGGFDYLQVNEWVGKDLLDIPFGGIVELLRESEPAGKVIDIIPIDGGLCFPTNNRDTPVGERSDSRPLDIRYFPYFSVSRIFMSPRTEIERTGWGMPPPERIYLAIALLCRGDKYYANLLLDTPPAGILDLIDMEEETAGKWLESWKSLLTGIDPYKIPVLYQHDKAAEFIPFTKSPSDIQFKDAIMQYAALCAAGYGLSLSDIGFQAVTSGGETLAGSIRQERRVKKSGQAIIKRKFITFRNKILPEYLIFKFIDSDEEQSVEAGRAALAYSTAAAQFIDKRIFTPEEMRLQAIANGIVTISVPEKIPDESEFPPVSTGSPERPSMLGRPIAVTSGGQGEIRQSIFDNELNRLVNIEDIRLKRLIRSSIAPIMAEISALNGNSILEDDNLVTWNEWHDELLWNDLFQDMPELTRASINDAIYEIDRAMSGDEWWRMCTETSEIANELHTLFEQMRINKLKEMAEHQYELGNINTILTEFPDDGYEKKFKQRVTRSVNDLWKTIPSRIKKAVISGTRKYLSIQNLRGTMEFDNFIISNENVAYVRGELSIVKDKLSEEFADIISSIINNMLGDIKWQDPKN
jgi:hypothetical protein